MNMIKSMIKKRRLAASIAFLTLATILLTSACAEGQSGGSSVSQGSGARVWIDQPASDATLPLAPFTLKAHAALEGGGITQIIFLANTVPVATIPTDASKSLAYAEFEWNPAEPGEYAIQAKAITGSGEALSGIAHLCIASPTGGEGACAVEPQAPAEITVTVSPTPTDTPTPVEEIAVNPSASPDPVYYGICLKREAQSLVIEARPSDDSGAVEVLARAWIESHNGSRDELPRQAMQKDGKGVYTTTYDLSKIDTKFMESQSGRVVYTISLVNKNKEFYVVTPEQFVVLMPCEATPTPVVEVKFKLGASPDPVYIGACKQGEPQIVTVDGYLSDDTAVAEARVKGNIEDASGTRVQAFYQIMTKAGDHYTAQLSVRNVNPKLIGFNSGRLIFAMSLINDLNETYATSGEVGIRAINCFYTPVPEQPVEAEQPPPEEEQPVQPRDTNPPTIRGGGPSSGTAYFDPKGLDPKGCQPTSVALQATVKDQSKLSSVAVFWYYASKGPGRTQSSSLSGRGGQYYFTFPITKGGDKIFYYLKAADVYNNVAQSGTFSFTVLNCNPTIIIKPRRVPTLPPIFIKPPSLK